MLKRIFSYRESSPAFFDMAVRFRPVNAPWYFGVFRIGDRAAAYIWLGNWRKNNPNRKLVVIEDSIMPGTELSRYIPGEWMFKDIADELWVIDSQGEVLAFPRGEPVFTQALWGSWARFYRCNVFDPVISPEEKAMERVDGILKENGLENFISFQPLFDARYDQYRNESPNWWYVLCRTLSEMCKVVVIGDPTCINQMGCPVKAFSMAKYGLNPMESLAVIKRAKVHVGGATGTSIWAPILKTPLLALYREWRPHPLFPEMKLDVRPISFGKPVMWGQLGGNGLEIARKAVSIAVGETTDSTLW